MLIHSYPGKVTQQVPTGPALCALQVCRPQETYKGHVALDQNNLGLIQRNLSLALGIQNTQHAATYRRTWLAPRTRRTLWKKEETVSSGQFLTQMMFPWERRIQRDVIEGGVTEESPIPVPSLKPSQLTLGPCSPCR